MERLASLAETLPMTTVIGTFAGGLAWLFWTLPWASALFWVLPLGVLYLAAIGLLAPLLIPASYVVAALLAGAWAFMAGVYAGFRRSITRSAASTQNQ